ncbi:MAG: ATP-binding cassette domain-containing protein [Lachnospiraceae bacterium]|nr:ATP-binding cassette domain-containing protein [Lachnospiraceae bacterium]
MDSKAGIDAHTPMIRTVNLKKHFSTPKGQLHAVDGVDLEIKTGQTLGVVGESGCGKSTLGRVILRLLDATDGSVYFEGKDIFRMSGHEMGEFRRQSQIIFQDPYASLNPRLSVSEIIMEPLIVNKVYKSRHDMEQAVYRMMKTVGLAARLINMYPHELDGGRRQRVGIARALVLNPKFIVCDEPVSALDVSIQAQILNLLMDLQEELNLTYMFITHDMSVVRHISNEIAVMYLGKCVERSPAKRLFENPMHPYTKALLSAIPVPNLSRRGKERQLLTGEISSPIEPEPGCRFAPRCAQAGPECLGRDIPLGECEPGHFVACAHV